MICYKDKTWCRHYDGCKHRDECHRPLTDEVIKAAEEWWGNEDAPIAVFVERPECYES